MPSILDTDERVDALTRAADALLAESGPGALTLRAIARRSGVSAPTLLQHLGSTEQVLRVCGHRSSLWRKAALTDAVRMDGPTGLLPADEQGLAAVRTWLGWAHVAHHVPGLDDSLAAARAGETSVLGRSLGTDPGPPVLRAARAVVDGLRLATCAPSARMPLDEAHLLLARALGDLVGVEVVPGRRLVGPEVWVWPFVPGPRADATTPVERLARGPAW